MGSRLTPKFIVAFILLLASIASAQDARQNRIVRAIDNRSAVRLQGTVHPLAQSKYDQGPASPTLPLQRMTLIFQPTADQQAALDQLLRDQQDPSSPDYHKWLTPEQFGDRFGLTQPDVDTVAAWLRSQGFTVVETAHSRTWIAFNGIAAQVEAAFHTSIDNYLVGGKVHYAASSDPAIPAAFAGVVSGIASLHNFAPHPRSFKAQPRVTSSITGNHFTAPGDFATIYDLPDYLQGVFQAGVDGTGQTIAVVGQTDLSTDSNPGRNGTPGAVVNGQEQQYDLVTFRNLAGLPALTSNNFQTIIVPGTTDPGVVTSDADEANLDVEWAGATAPNAALIFVIENANAAGAFGALEWAVDNVPANVFSISYGVCEPQLSSADKTAMTAAGLQANAQGQTIVAPSGDSGAADCDTNAPATQGLAVDFPGSLQYFTSMGGTTFSADSANSSNPSAATQYWSGATNDTNPSALAYIPETSWNDTPSTTPVLSATGGGVSTLSTSKPIWQTGLGVPNDNARDIPDISFTASPNQDGYLICSQSSCVTGYRNTDTTFDVIGGTSAPTPAFAGIVALINQKLGAPQGNINPDLYTQATSAPWAFHDITTGNNIVSCTTGTGCINGSLGYSAGTGYDLVTGLGTPDVGALINALTNVPDFSVSPSVTAVTIPANGSTTLTLNVLGTTGSNITFTCSASSTLTATTCSAPPVTANGGTAVASTLSVNNASANSETGSVTVTASNGTTTHPVPIGVTVNGTNPDFAVTASVGSLTLNSAQSGTATISVTPIAGFTSDVALTCTVTTTLAATTCSLSPATVAGGSGNSTLTVNGATLTGMLRGAPPFSHPGVGAYASFVFAFGAVLVPLPPQRSRLKKRAILKGLFSLMALAILLGIVSCGGGSSRNNGGGGTTPIPLNGTVTITGTSGTLTHSVSIAVTIQ